MKISLMKVFVEFVILLQKVLILMSKKRSGGRKMLLQIKLQIR